MAAAQGLAWPLPPGSLAVAGVSLQQTSVKPSEVLAGASGVFWLQKRPPFSAAMMVIFTDLFLLSPTPFCATDDPPGSLAADDLVSDSTSVWFCVHPSPGQFPN